MNQQGVAKRIAILIASSILASSILIFLLFVCIPVASAYVHDKTVLYAYRVPNSNGQGTPTVDPTVTALQKEQLAQQINLTALQKEQLAQQLDQQQRTPWNWIWNNGIAILTPLALVGGGFFALYRWLGDRRDARKKQSEERFKSVVEGLGGESTETKVASAVLLRTFLAPDYQEFYAQVFDLAVASLRSPKYTNSSKLRSPKYINSSSEIRSPDSLSQAFVTVFKDAFPRARDELKKQLSKQKAQFDPQFLDATGVQLNEAFLFGADLRQASMRGASLRKANLIVARLDPIQLENAILTEAQLGGAFLSGAYLSKAHLENAILERAHLTEANLSKAHLENAILKNADFRGANLSQAILENTDLTEANLSKANLTGANLSRANLTGAILENTDFREANLSGAILENAANLSKTKLAEANLSKTKLAEANLTEAILENTDFREANLSGAILENADLIGANLSGANLTGANLSRANLTGAILAGAILENTDFREAKVTSEQLVTVKSFLGAIMPNGLILP